MRILALLTSLLVLNGCMGEDKGSNEPSIADYQGQWLVINYWAKWCKPCLNEIPELNEFDRMFDHVSVLGVNYDGATGEDLSQQISDFSIEFPVLSHDPAAQLGTRQPNVLPTTLILNPQGELIATLLGPQTVLSLTLATEQSVAAK